MIAVSTGFFLWNGMDQALAVLCNLVLCVDDDNCYFVSPLMITITLCFPFVQYYYCYHVFPL